jgi:hypothetical protein
LTREVALLERDDRCRPKTNQAYNDRTDRQLPLQTANGRRRGREEMCTNVSVDQRESMRPHVEGLVEMEGKLDEVTVAEDVVL